MKILFVGLLYNPDEEQPLIKKSLVGLSVASNVFQWNFIEGLIDNISKSNVEICGSIPAGNYPKLNRILRFKSKKQEYKEIVYDEIGFINFYFIKHFIRKFQLQKKIKSWIKENENEDKLVVFYDLYEPFLKTIKWIKKFNNTKSCLIVPDLVGKYRNNMERGKLVDFILEHKEKKILLDASSADYHVLLTKYMEDIIKVKNGIVIDGIINSNNNITLSKGNNSNRVIMYAGALSQEYNIDILLRTFHKFNNKRFQLWFCGKGGMEGEIVKACEKDSRIKYLGFLDKKSLQILEEKVSFYINPRSNSGIFTKYSFPSKNLEYMLAGKPVICCKLDGMSDEYNGLFLYLEEMSERSILEMLGYLEKLSEEEICKLGNKGREYVLKYKNRRVQTKKFLDFVQEKWINE